MILDMRCFGLPKAGNAPEEYEDAYAAYSDATLRCNRPGAWQVPVSQHPTRVAAADGATETSFSGIWAKILVRHFCKGRMDSNDTLSRCRRIWQRSVSKKPLPWYAEQKLAMGAFAALIGLSIVADKGSHTGHWRARGLGDSCLFQFRGGQRIVSFPMERWEEFSSRPILLSSVASTAERMGKLVLRGFVLIENVAHGAAVGVCGTANTGTHVAQWPSAAAAGLGSV